MLAKVVLNDAKHTISALSQVKVTPPVFTREYNDMGNGRSEIIKSLIDDLVKDISRVSIGIQALQVNLNLDVSPIQFSTRPVRKKTLYNTWYKDNFSNCKEEHPEWDATRITKKLVRDWREFSDDDKEALEIEYGFKSKTE